MTVRSYFDGRAVMHRGDSRDVLKTLGDASIDSVVCDPPYALVSIVKRFGSPDAAPSVDKRGESGPYMRASAGFMGQQWDTGETAFAIEFWAEVFRVLKPGGHVVAFSGTRTYHRLAVAIEDAGFEIRDQLAWAYGTGFPKSHDVALGLRKTFPTDRRTTRAEYVAFRREMRARAREWEGWGTALKPAWEPIVLARKPLIGTVAENVLAFRTGAINVDGCRIETSDNLNGGAYSVGERERGGSSWGNGAGGGVMRGANGDYVQPEGRFPANIMHDGSPEVLAGFPETGKSTGGQTSKASGFGEFGNGSRAVEKVDPGFGDSGSAARFFYCAKASKADRAGSKHPTVKPVALMRWLVRLVTPPGGTVLEPFAGSGSTLQAAIEEGARVIGVEREVGFYADCCRRLIRMGAEPVGDDGEEPAVVVALPPAKPKKPEPRFLQDSFFAA